MNTEILQRDPRWQIFYGDISLEDFMAKLPIDFYDDVAQDVKDAFGVIHKLMVYSYYEYLFIDVAVTKALQTFEMALKLRYKQLNDSEWTKNLAQLIEHFRKSSYFELDTRELLDHVRKMRNHLSHPRRHNVGGTVRFHWINTTVDLINDIYEDVATRKQRKGLRNKITKRLRAFIQEGGKIISKDHEILIYDIGHVLVNNLIQPFSVTCSLLKVFDRKSSEIRWPLVITFKIDALEFKSELIRIDSESKEFILTNALTDSQKNYVKTFNNSVAHDTEVSMDHQSLLFDSQNVMLKKWRQLRRVRRQYNS